MKRSRMGSRAAVWLPAVLIAVAGSTVPARAQCVPPPAGLVGWWRAEGGAHDSRRTNHGTLENGASFAAGQVGRAFSLDGSSDFVSVPDSPAWTFGSHDFTVELWVNLDTVRPGPPGRPGQVLIGHDEGAGGTNKWAFYPAAGVLVFHINSRSGGSVFLTVPFVMSAARWYHLAVTRSGSTFTFFADGAAVGTASSTQVVPDANAPLTIGRTEAFFTDGQLDEAAIYSRALSLQEIAAIYNAGSAGKCACYPDCDTSTGPRVLDIFDYLRFQNAYAAGDPYACDCDTSTGPGVCDIFDILCFQTAFDAGCP